MPAFDIRTAMTSLLAIEGRLVITVPSAQSIKRTYRYWPNQDGIAPDAPCFFNTWSMAPVQMEGGLRIQNYAIHMRLLVDDADEDTAADIATSFHVALVDALSNDVQLKGDVTPHIAAPTCATAILRGGNPTLAQFERAGRFFIGLDEYLDVTMKEGWSFQ